MKKNFSILFATALLLAACSTSTPSDSVDSSTANGRTEATSTNDNQTDMTSNFDQTALPSKGEQIVVMETSKGTIKLRLFPEQAPKTVENFMGLAQKGYYNGIMFHRVIPGFMIQGGDPTATGMGGESLWGSSFEDEFSDELSNIPGSLSMANAGPNTNGSQFFINQVNNNFLDGRHTVFGQVFEGMDIVDEIASVQTGAQDKPVEDVRMENVTVENY